MCKSKAVLAIHMKRMHKESRENVVFTCDIFHQELSTEGAAGQKAREGQMRVWKGGEQEEYSPSEEELYRSEENQRS